MTEHQARRSGAAPAKTKPTALSFPSHSLSHGPSQLELISYVHRSPSLPPTLDSTLPHTSQETLSGVSKINKTKGACRDAFARSADSNAVPADAHPRARERASRQPAASNK